MKRLSDTSRAALDAEAGRTLSADEVRAYLEAPISDSERREVRELVRWFRRRYPTGADRLAYVRRAYARWSLQRVRRGHS